MIRVVHLRSQNGDFQTEQTAALLQSGTPAGFSIETRHIGFGSDHRHPISAGWALRRENFDLLHAWDTTALAAATMASSAPILYSPSSLPTRRSIRWLNLITRFRDVLIVSANSAQHRAFAAAGFLPPRASLIRPGAKELAHAAGQRAALRKALELRDDDHVILCPGESTRAANHELATWVAAILHFHDPRHKLLLWGRGTQANKAARLSMRLRRPDLYRLAEAKLGRQIEFSQLTAAADTVLHTATTKASTYALAVCMAAGLPIVAVASSANSDLLEDRRNAIVLPTRAARSLAQRVLELRADQNLQRSIAEQAQSDARTLFSSARCLAQFHELYRRIVHPYGAPTVEPTKAFGSLKELPAKAPH